MADENTTVAVNQQIIDAVKQSNEFVFGQWDDQAGGPRTSGSPSGQVVQGTAIAYEKVAQATAYAIQDATDYQRNVETISTAAQGRAMAGMLKAAAANDPEQLGLYALVLVLAMVEPLVAVETFKEIGVVANDTLSSFGK